MDVFKAYTARLKATADRYSMSLILLFTVVAIDVVVIFYIGFSPSRQVVVDLHTDRQYHHQQQTQQEQHKHQQQQQQPSQTDQRDESRFQDFKISLWPSWLHEDGDHPEPGDHVPHPDTGMSLSEQVGLWWSSPETQDGQAHHDDQMKQTGSWWPSQEKEEGRENLDDKMKQSESWWPSQETPTRKEDGDQTRQTESWWGSQEKQDGVHDPSVEQKTYLQSQDTSNSREQEVMDNYHVWEQQQDNLFKSLPNQATLDLRRKNILTLRNFPRLSNMVKLDLSYNLIEAIDSDELKQSQNLEWLSLAHNRIYYLSAATFGGGRVNWLSLANNKILSLPARMFRDMAYLQTLDLSHNAIDSVDRAMFPGNDPPVTVDLSYNAFASPPFSDCAGKPLPQLRVTSAGNPFRCDCDTSVFENCLDWIHTSTLYTTKSLFADVEMLRCKMPNQMSGKLLTEISLQPACDKHCPELCSCFVYKDTKTLVVNCSHTQLQQMPDYMPMPNYTIRDSQTNGFHLHIDHNYLTALNHKPYLENLTELYADNSRITSVKLPALKALKDVQVLTLHGNSLRRLPAGLRNVKFQNIRELRLEDNNWRCSCEDAWMQPWMTQHKRAILGADVITCVYPDKSVLCYLPWWVSAAASIDCMEPQEMLVMQSMDVLGDCNDTSLLWGSCDG